MKSFLSLFSVLFCLACQPEKSTVSQVSPVDDPHSFAEPEKVVVSHLDLDLKADFESKTLVGKAVWTLENKSLHDELVLDTRGLEIQKVELDGGEEVMFALGDEEKYLGRPLSIQIRPETKKVTIWYKTSPHAAALQWLNPQQTAGKQHPFLFTQSQAILARTWIPCQDSPAIRFTYDASVTVPGNLLALMSAENPQKKNAIGHYTFRQRRAIPAYLMALAVGDLAFQQVGKRTGIYAEPVTLKRAAWEFADMEKMVNEAEALYGKYRWGRYDVLVLPPSFPFGGMENPMLTFATPTVITGDRSLSLIAHELAHSWSGNLVTNATWNDFWLNEGFTTYFERRIVEAVFGVEEAKMQEVLGFQSLKEELAELGEQNADTRLKADFAGRDPDEGVSDIAYEKGYFFLRTIEEAVGRPKFDAFLKDYFAAHAFHSVTTEDFIRFLEKNLLNTKLLKEKVDVTSWVYEPGIPSNVPPVGSAQFSAIDSLINSWAKNKQVSGLGSRIRSTNERLYFISRLPEKLSIADMRYLDKEFGFTESGNAEIQTGWYVLAIRNKYEPANPYIEKFLVSVGRRKFLLPIYKELIKSERGKVMAKAIYAKARRSYHAVSFQSIDKLLN